MDSPTYIAVDGDNVGSHLEYLMLTNDMETLSEFSRRYEASMQWFAEQLKIQISATVIFSGGDNLLAQTPAKKGWIDILRSLCAEFSVRTGYTFSVGLGDVPRHAYFALKLAKTSGKNTIRHFEELTHV